VELNTVLGLRFKIMLKMAKKSVKKTVKKPKQVCGQCVFYVANKDKKAIGVCLQVTGIVKEGQSPACKGKYFKQRV
jgi:hypothetical protein